MKYSIYEENMERLSKKMTRIQNKCRKYGCDFKYEEVGEEFRELKDDAGNTYTARFVVIEAEGVAEVSGWKFIASVEHTEKGNIIKSACDIEVPERYYTGKPVCEHCNSKRYRKDTFIVMNTETGEFKQVGKSCLKDFTHGMSAEAVAQYTAAHDELIKGETPVEGSRIESYINVEDYLRYAAETIRYFGYVKSDAFERGTWERALEYYGTDRGYRFFFNGAEETYRKEMESVGFDADSKESQELTAAALEWLSAQEEASNYIHNLKVACSLDYTKRGNLGLLASLFPAYNRDLTKREKVRKEKEAASKSEYVGEIGQRIEVKIANIVCVTSWETQWGLTKIYKITDESGNIFTWKTSSWVADNAKTLKGTVKEHKEYRGAKQTELTRCKVA